MKEDLKKKADALILASLLEYANSGRIQLHDNIVRGMGDIMDRYHFKSRDPEMDIEFSNMVEQARMSFKGLDEPPDNVRLLFMSRYGISI